MGENCPKLLDLIPKGSEWNLKREGGGDEEEKMRSCCDESKKLELRLGLPGWSVKKNDNNPWGFSGYQRKESSQSQPCCSRIVELQNPVVPNTSQKRAAPAPVVGWPPIRSFRKNLASTSATKLVSESRDPNPTKPVNEKPVVENSNKGMFVKINMDGVPIGRKVDLVAYDSYDKLSSAVDDLFRGLLAAQRNSPAGGIDIENKQEEQKPIDGLLDGSGEYTLVYEDNEGDRMLVGDVPWHMFVSTVKRLRVLKSSDIPTLGCGGSKEGKMRVESALN